MRSIGAIGMLAAALVACLCQPGAALASDYGIELNGTYRVISNGDWAKNNDVFMEEQTVIQTWTMSSSCANPVDCTGEVKSDQGWSAPMVFTNSRWIVKRDVPNWEPCPDGSAAPGAQQFVFWGVNEEGMNFPKNTGLMAGWDHTSGPSGACGINKPLVIRLPLRLERQS